MQLFIYQFDDGRYCAGSGATTERLENAKFYKRRGDALNAASLCWVQVRKEIGGRVRSVTLSVED